MNQLLTFIYTVVGFQSLLLSIVFFLKKDNTLANRILGFTFALMTLSFASGYLTYNQESDIVDILNTIWLPSLFLYAPLIYLYVMILIKKIERIDLKQTLRIVAFILFSILSLLILISPDIAELSFFKNIVNGSSLTYYEFIMIQIGLLQMMIYYVYMSGILKRHSNSIQEFFSDIDKLKLLWLKRLLFIFQITVSTHFIINIVNVLFTEIEEELFFIMETAAAGTGFLCIFIIAYSALNQPEIFNKIDEMKKEDAESPKYTKQRLDESTEKTMLNKLLKYMDEESPFLDNNLTLKQLSEEVDIPTHQITMILNLHMKQNYYTFINSYRIKEACKLLSDRKHDHKNILSIAMDTGFNSKSTFNTIFRKTTGQTPREYRNSFN